MAEKGIDFAKQTNIYKEKKQKKLFMKGMAFSFLVPIAALGMLGAVYFYKIIQERKVAKIESQIEQERSQRDFNELAEILSVSTKLNFVREFSQKQKFWSGFLGEIAGKTFPSIHFESIEGASSYELKEENAIPAVPVVITMTGDKDIIIGMVASSLNDISKQIVAFKKSNKVESITIGDIALEDRGLVFLMTLKLTPVALERVAYEIENPSSIEVDISEPGSSEPESSKPVESSALENEKPGEPSESITDEELNNLNPN